MLDREFDSPASPPLKARFARTPRNRPTRARLRRLRGHTAASSSRSLEARFARTPRNRPTRARLLRLRGHTTASSSRSLEARCAQTPRNRPTRARLRRLRGLAAASPPRSLGARCARAPRHAPPALVCCVWAAWRRLRLRARPSKRPALRPSPRACSERSAMEGGDRSPAFATTSHFARTIPAGMLGPAKRRRR